MRFVNPRYVRLFVSYGAFVGVFLASGKIQHS